MANIHNLLNNGLKVTIGSDGMTSNILKLYKNSFLFTKYQNKNPDIGFEEMKKMFLNSYELKEAFGFPMGLKEGEKADFAITNYIPYTPFSQDNFWGHFIYGITESTIKYLFSSGEFILDYYRFKNYEKYDKYTSKELEISKKLFKKFENL